MNPNEIAFVLVTYLLFVLRIGPLLMEGRSPLQMNRFLVIFNAIKVVISGMLSCQFYSYIMNKGVFPRKCDHGDSNIHTIAVLYWKYLATKILDLFDTVFFVIRKKSDHVTFLHVYHHTFMVICTWTTLKYDPSDHWGFMALANTFVHTTMHTYYGIAAMGPRFVKYLWWKKYLTLLQIVQFLLIILQIVVQTYTTQCPVRSPIYWLGLSNLSLFICLFIDFYHSRYKSRTEGSSVGSSSIEFACTKQATD